jgi:hypothetical protein
MNSTVIDFETSFRPTDEQIASASEFIAETGVASVLVAVCFPGKQRGIWVEGMIGLAVMDGPSRFAMWTDRGSAMTDFDSGRFGNAIFRVYPDGHTHLVDEA